MKSKIPGTQTCVLQRPSNVYNRRLTSQFRKTYTHFNDQRYAMINNRKD